jgi:hypothetical protein
MYVWQCISCNSICVDIDRGRKIQLKPHFVNNSINSRVGVSACCLNECVVFMYEMKIFIATSIICRISVSSSVSQPVTLKCVCMKLLLCTMKNGRLLLFPIFSNKNIYSHHFHISLSVYLSWMWGNEQL